MAELLGDEMPLFLQIKRKIEDMIVNGSLKAGEQIPSTTQMVKFYQVNHLTVLKGINMLVDEGIVYKKRGVGMFVGDSARRILRDRRQGHLVDDYIRPLLREAEQLGIPSEKLISMVKHTAEEEGYDER